jgi:hypothetical protein
MPILNLNKVKKEETKEDVPDELPSLPSQPVKAPEPTEQKVEKIPAASINVIKQAELAPDELPTVEQKETTVEVMQQKEEEPKQKVLDERLFFAKLIKRLNDGASIEEIEKELKSRDILVSLNNNIAQNIKEDHIVSIQKEIKVLISELQGLEKDWGSLKIELEKKRTRFEETERNIIEKTNLIKTKFADIEGFRR